MNRIYRVIWSKMKEKWVVVSEKVAAKGVRPALTVGCLTAAAIFATSGMALALDPGALPTGGRVAAGSALISQSGISMTVDQQTSRMIANWDTFNIGQNASVRFNQPGASSVALNRIADQSPSQILGSLSANGQVFLLNPAGIVFGQSAQVDVGGLVASSLNMTDADFLAGTYHLSGNGGSVLNQGTIATVEGGVVAFVGDQVGNEGTISTPGGSTALIAGDEVTLDFTGDGLINYSVERGAIDAQAENKGLIQADGGMVVMTAKAADELAGSVVNNEGVIQASSLTSRGGRIILDGDMVVNTGTVDASGLSGGEVTAEADYLMNAGTVAATGGNGDGGEILLQADRIVQTDAASLDAAGSQSGGDISLIAGAGAYDGIFSSAEISATGEQGGNLTLAGNRIDLRGATLDASGETKGGSIRVGGDLHGGEWSDPISGEALVNSQITDISPENTLDASASSGDGGSVVVWSEQKTYFYGDAAATGTTNGGFIEISSKDSLQYGGSADASSPTGTTGTVLFDPKDIVIDNAAGGGAVNYTAFVNPNPSADSEFGSYITTLSTGNMVVTDALADVGAVTDAGAVYLFQTDGTLISTLTGSNNSDQVSYDYTNWEGGTTALTNGNFAVSSPAWDGFKGAVTWGDGTTGVSGIVSSANSLVGSQANDRVGASDNWQGVFALTNGNYVVTSSHWANGANTEAGAATWVDGSTGQTMNATNTISAANSIIGSTTDDKVGAKNLAVLSNGNYAVVSPWWDNGGVSNAGAVTWGDGSSGTAGTISAANSLVGTYTNDEIGMGEATALTNGNYVVSSFYWHNASNTQVGAATWVDGSTGQTMNATNTVSAANSLVGSTVYDNISGTSITALTNGNYVVTSSSWDNGGVSDVGAATWGDGATGSAGLVSAANSLVGSQAGDAVGNGGAVALTNGNYVVITPYWNNGAVTDAGAVTWGNGATGTTGAVTTTNSLVGSASMDFASTQLVPLTNGNYVFASTYWGGFKGMVAWGDGSTGGTRLVGTVSAANALVGTKTGTAYKTPGSADANTGDEVGYKVVALANGNYVVTSPMWTNGGAGIALGAATWGDGTTGVVGTISAANSLIGSQSYDYVGSLYEGATALTNGNYVVGSPYWDDGVTADVGAATWGDGTTGIVGTISSTNSLIGSTASDKVSNFGIVALDNGNYVVGSYLWDNGADADSGAVTWADGTTGLTGTISSDNSLIGSAGKQLGTFVVAGIGDIFGAVDLNYAGGGVYSVSQLSAYAGGYNFADNADQLATLTSASLTDILNTGSNLILQANNDITVSSAVTVNNAGGDGGNLTMQAGRSILLNANITTDNGDLTLVANETLANGVVDAQRDAGAAVITMAAGTSIDAGNGTVDITLADGAGKTDSDSGDINLRNITSGELSVTNDGPTAGSDVSLNGTITASGNISVETTAANSNITIGGNIVKSSGADATATFKASGNIIQNAGVSINSTSNKLNTVLWADSDATDGGYININNGIIKTNGGAISLVGGTDGTGYAEGTSTQTASPPHQDGISLHTTTLDSRVYIAGTPQTSGGGAITLKGKGYAGNLTLHGGGLWAGYGFIYTGGGDIVMDVQAQENVGATEGGIRYGAYLDNMTISTNGGDVQISTASPSTTWTGFYAGNTSSITAGTGSITLSTDQISLSGATISGTGTLTIQPITSDTTIGMAGGTGTLNIDATEWGYFQNGFSNITIGNATAGAITVGASALSYNDPLTLKTGNSIFFDVAAALTGNNNDLTLWTRAGGNDAGDDGIEGSVWMPVGSSIDTGGGDVIIGGGSDPTIGYALGDNAATSSENNARYRGVAINGSIDAGGGNVSIRGIANQEVSAARGVSVGGSIATSGSGTIDIAGIAKGSSDGLALGDSSLGGSSVGTLSSVDGTITLTGVKDTGSNGINLSTVGSGITTSGNLAMTSTGNISGANGVLDIGGTTSMTAGTSNISLTNAGNDFTGAVSVVSAGNLSLIDSDTLSLGAVSASGTIDIATLAGNLTLTDAVSSDDTTSAAITLNAGKSTDAGTATGGSIIVSGGSVSTGAGGRATLYSGSIAGSTGLTALIGSGSGNFRYNSDESAANYSTVLGTGKFAIYREQPTLTYTAENQTMTYGGTLPTLTTTLSGLQNGDTSAQAISSAATVSVGGSTSSTGSYTAEDHTLTPAGAAGGLGYGFSYATGTLTVNKKIITTSGITATDKVYDSTTAATINTGAAMITGGAAADDDNKYYTGDAISLTVGAATGSFADKNVGTGKAVTVSGLGLIGADAGNYNLIDGSGPTADITAKAITASGITAGNKVYDATLTASLNTGGATLTNGAAAAGDNKYYTGDTVGLDFTSVSGSFADKNVGNGKAVTIGGLALTGADAGNYTVSDASGATANITPKALSVSGISADNKVYDATTAATVNSAGAVLTGLIGADAVTVSATGTFADKNAGVGKTVTLASSYGGADAGNYAITDQASTTATITPKDLTLGGITANNKVYDGTTSATLNTAGVTFTGLLGGDSVSLGGVGVGTFADKNVDTGKTVTVSGYTLGGTDAGNYAVGQPTGLTADITAKALSVSGITASNKTYDATTAANVSSASAVLTGLIGGDTVTVSSTGTFTDKNVGNGKTVTLASTYGGADAGNYSITDQASTTANITAAALSVSGITADNKVYDSTTAATVNSAGAVLTGLLGADAVTVSATGTFADKNAGVGKTVTLASSYGGADAGNYTITDQASTAANITAKAITASGITAGNKVYDSTVTANLNTGGAGLTGGGATASDNKYYTGDTVSLDVSGASGSFADKNVGTGKAVTVSGLTLSGADAGNYTVSDASGATANITAKAITSSGITADNKGYDGTVAAAINTGGAVITGGATAADDNKYYTGDTLGLDLAGATGVFADKNVGTSKAVSVSGLALTGADAGNYTLTDGSGATADISPKAITLTADARSKTYGDADPGLTYGSDVALAGGDSFTGALSRAVGEDIGSYAIGRNTLTIDDGNGGNNYTLAYVGDSLTINQCAITLTADSVSKTYGDADPALSVSVTAGSLGSVAVSDSLTDVTGLLSRQSGENVGAYDVLLGTGVKAGNYAITFTADNNALAIARRPLTLTADPVSKTYGVPDPALAVSITAGSLGSVTVSDSLADVTGTLSREAGEEAGTYDIQLGTGVQAANYDIDFLVDNNAFTIVSGGIIPDPVLNQFFSSTLSSLTSPQTQVNGTQEPTGSDESGEDADNGNTRFAMGPNSGGDIFQGSDLGGLIIDHTGYLEDTSE